MPIIWRIFRARSVFRLVAIFVIALTLVSCGGGSDEMSQFAKITSTSRCAFSVPVGKPDNCMLEKFEGDSYVTDQNTIHLSGISSATKDDGCPEPVFLGPP